ncbi:MAG: glycerol kinase GlpK [Gemmatimonadota bacterium]|nr:MAG: glycerol kinase GlpK [Gemmatimonadota bacterium]
MTSLLALDQGTTGSTAIVFSSEGRVLGRGYREFTQHFPQPGWVEHDPLEIWQVTVAAAREAIDSAGEEPVAVGITNQRETVVVWDRGTGEPLHRALVWQDRRTAERCRELEREYGPGFVAERTGLVWDPYFSATKIEWLLGHVSGLRAKAEAGDAVFGTIDSWLVFKLTSGRTFVTDHTNACRTLLYGIDQLDWHNELLELFGVPLVALPQVCKSSETVGICDPVHLGIDAPIAGIAGDQQAALFGQACWRPGQAKCTYGTGAFLLMNVGADRRSQAEGTGVLTTVACDQAGGPAYALEGSIFIAGAVVQWLRDGLGLIEHAAETENLARSVADSGGVYFVPALVGLGAPHWEAEARGTIAGLTRGARREHLVRAALEAMAYSVKDVVIAMEQASGVHLDELNVDGGAAANEWLMQFQADVLGVSVARPAIVESTALGAAGLAGLAAGVWRDAQEFAQRRELRWFRPEQLDPSFYAGWSRALEAALYWARRPLKSE